MHNRREKMTLQQQIDQLAKIKVQKMKLEKAHAELLNSIKEKGAGIYEGTDFDLTISVTNRAIFDTKSAKAKLSRQFITAHTNVKEVVTHSWRAK